MSLDKAAMWGYGTAQVQTLRSWIESRRADAGEDVPDPPWKLIEPVIALAAYEVPRAVVADLLPTSLAIPIPGYARITALTCADSPIGAFAFCALTVGSRATARFSMGNEPRDFVVDLVAQGGLLEGSGSGFALPVRPGTVHISRSGSTAETVVEDGGGVLAILKQPRLSPLDPTMIRYDKLVYPSVEGESISTRSARILPTPAEAFRDTSFSLESSPPGTGTVWSLLRSHHPITSTLADCVEAVLEGAGESELVG